MIDSVPRPDSGLHEFLAARARHASDGRLAAYTVGGALGAFASAYWAGPGWYLLVSAALCFFGFGVWGVADRELGERAGGGGPRVAVLLLGTARAVAAIVGFLAAAFLMMALLGKALGTIIS